MESTSSDEMKKIVRKIARSDPAFAPVIKQSTLCSVGLNRNGRSHYQTLVHSILSQQLATKAAATITARVAALAGGKIKPETMIALSPEDLRGAGVSGAKARAISELTTATLEKSINFHKFPRMSNAAISAELTSLWGIGRWTVEMFLIFHLGRLDVWPVGDLGVRRGWERLHQLPEQIKPEALDLHGEIFAGHQSVVAWYCWRALEGENSAW
jgi:DNA-3-methyladenine glycosylase II